MEIMEEFSPGQKGKKRKMHQKEVFDCMPGPRCEVHCFRASDFYSKK